MPATAPARFARRAFGQFVRGAHWLRLGLWLLALALAGAGGAAEAQVTFQLKVIDGSGPSKVWGKGAGDLDGDGKVDVIAGSLNGGLFWYQNPAWTKRTISSGAKIEEDMEVVDLDKDGRKDIVSVTTGGVTWFRNTGTAWTATVLVTGLDIHDIEVKDLDGDGKLDLIGRNQSTTGNILYFWRQGASVATWTRTTITLPESGEGLLAVDLDRDGKIDVVVGKYWFKNGSTPGAFNFTRYTYNTGAEKNAFIAAGKINKDNYVDLVVTPSEPKGGTGDIAWYQAPATTTAGWTKKVIQGGVESVHHFVGIADFDQDGDNDVATAMTHVGTNPKVKLFYNTDGAGTFGPATIIANTSSHSMKIVDIANNGLKSLYGADYGNTGPTDIDLWQAQASSPAPVAVADTATTAANTAVKVSVLANDTGTGLTVSAVTTPANGAAAINADQTVSYTPTAGFAGTDSFQYTIKDTTNRTASATVTVTVRSAAPVAAADTAATAANTAVKVSVLANDTGTGLTVSAVTTPANGAAAINADQTVSYTPATAYTGTDSFQYTIKDATNRTASATVTVTVRNAAPVAVDDTATTETGTAVSIAVLGNDSDPDGHALTISAVSDPPNGTAAINTAKTAITYTPDSGFSGTDSFSYTASDGRGGTDTATVSVTVSSTAPVYLGCFKDQGTAGSLVGRDLDGFLLSDTQGMTTESCAATCRSRGYTFAGTQAGKQCFCGNDYGSFGTSSNCSTPCTGNSGQTCGGSWANSVYRLP